MAEGEARAELALLEVIRACQQQNGLRHRDYQRYREYCARRLRRLRKSLDVKYAAPKAPFEIKRVQAEQAQAEPRTLLIPLMNAERAWGYAMQLKDENQRAGEDPRKRLHLVRRLSKAAKWSAELRDLCAKVADDRTSLEAEAYAAWMRGTMLLEKEAWKDAYIDFEKARSIYTELSAIGSTESQELMRARVEEIEPSLRYCSYNLSREHGPGKSQDALRDLMAHGASAVGNDLLQSKIRKVMEDARKAEADQAFKLSWRGKAVAVRSEAARVKLLEVRDQRAELAKALAGEDATPADADGSSGVDEAFSSAIAVLTDAASTLREEQRKASKLAGPADADKVASEFADILDYLKAVKLQLLLQRNLMYAASMEAGQGSKPVAQDLANMYDRTLQNVHDLLALFGAENPAAVDLEADWEPHHPDDLTLAGAKVMALQCEANKTRFVAQWYAQASRWAESSALLERALELVAEAQGVPQLGEAQKEALAQVERKVRATKCQVLAKSFKSKLARDAEDAGAEPGGAVEVCALPPPIEAVPCSPVVFDLAFSELRVGDYATGDGAASGAASPRDDKQKPSGWLSSARGWFTG